jgi:hypothetical protein
VAVYSAFCGTADVFFGLQDSREQETQKTVLDYNKMFSEPKGTLSGVGV